MFSVRFFWLSPNTRTPAPGVMKLTILVDASLFIITVYLICLNLGVEKKILKKYTPFTPNITSPWHGGGGSMKFTVSRSLPYSS